MLECRVPWYGLLAARSMLLLVYETQVLDLKVRVVFAALCAEASASNAYGASLLNLLHSRAKTSAGNVCGALVLQRLLQDAAAPYFEVLTKWISTGILDDPFSEFMVVEVPGMNVDAELDGQSAFWVGGHKLRTRTAADGTEVLDVPVFLFDVQEHVLKAGVHMA
jgi:Gamma tubulin complex component N-terminal